MSFSRNVPQNLGANYSVGVEPGNANTKTSHQQVSKFVDMLVCANTEVFPSRDNDHSGRLGQHSCDDTSSPNHGDSTITPTLAVRKTSQIRIQNISSQTNLPEFMVENQIADLRLVDDTNETHQSIVQMEPMLGDFPFSAKTFTKTTTQSPNKGMFHKRKASEIHYMRNTMNFSNMNIKGQGLLKQDNLMSPTGGENLPRQSKTRGGTNSSLGIYTSYGITPKSFISKNIEGHFAKKSGSTIEKIQPQSTKNQGQVLAEVTRNRLFSQQTCRRQHSKKTRNDSNTHNMMSSQVLTSQSLSRTQAINSVLDEYQNMRYLFANPASQSGLSAKVVNGGTSPREQVLPEIKELRKPSIATESTAHIPQTNERTMTAPVTPYTTFTDTAIKKGEPGQGLDKLRKDQSKVKIQDQASPVEDRTNGRAFTVQERGKRIESKDQSLLSSMCQKQIIERLKEKQRMKVQMTMQQYVKESTTKEKRVDFEERRPQVSTGPAYPRKNEKVDIPREIMLGSLFPVEGTDFGASYKELSEMQKNLHPKKGHDKYSNKASKSFDINVLETWINETLREAEYFDVRGCIQRTATEGGGSSGSTGKVVTVCMDYGIDRLTLNNTGISNESIDKLYRCLFTTTMGFFSQLKEVLEQSSDHLKLSQSKMKGHGVDKVYEASFEGQKRHSTKASLLSALWRVYCILIEYAYSSEYKLQISEIQEESSKKMEEKQKQLHEMTSQASAKQAELREQLRDTQGDFRKCQEELKIAKQDLVRAQNEMITNTSQQEEEVILRMKFEEKLNNLFSLNRSFNEAAERNNDLYQQKASELTMLYEKFTKSQNDLTQAQSDLESLKQYKITTDEKLAHQVLQINTFRSQNSQMQKTFDETNRENFDLKKVYRDQTDEFQKVKVELSNLKEDFAAQTKLYEKQKSMYLNKSKQSTIYEAQKDELKEQINLVTGKYEKSQMLFERADEQKEKISKENEARRLEQFELKAKVKKYENEILTLTHSMSIAEYGQKISEELNLDTQQKIELIDIDRNKQIADLKQARKDISTLDTKITDNNLVILSLKEQNQCLEVQLQDTEFQANEHKKRAYAKEMELDQIKKNTTDKIAFLERKIEWNDSQAEKFDQKVKDLEDKNQISEDMIKGYKAATDQQGNKILRLDQEIEQNKETIARAEENRIQLMAEKSSYFQQKENLQVKLLKEHQMRQFLEGDKQKEIDVVEDELAALKKENLVEQMIIEDYLSTTFRALSKVQGLNEHIRQVTEENIQKSEKVQKIEAEMRKVQKEMFVEQSRTKEETRLRVDAEQEIGTLKLERDAKILTIETMTEKIKEKDVLLNGQELEIMKLESVNEEQNEIISARKAIEDSLVEGSCQTEINYYPFTRNIEVQDIDTKSSEKATPLPQNEGEDQQADNIVVLEQNTKPTVTHSQKSLSDAVKIPSTTNRTLELQTPNGEIEKKEDQTEDEHCLKSNRAESDISVVSERSGPFSDSSSQIKQEIDKEQKVEEPKVVEDLSMYSLGDLTIFTDLIRENLQKVQRRVNKDKIVLEQFPYWDRYVDQDAQCDIVLPETYRESEDVQIRDVGGQLSVDIHFRDSSNLVTGRNKSHGTEMTDGDEDQEAMKSKLPSSFDDPQTNKTGKGKSKKGQKQSKTQAADKQGQSPKKKAKTNCCEPTCICKCNMKNSPRGGGQPTGKHPFQNVAAKDSPERKNQNSPAVGKHANYSQFKLGVQMGGAMRQAVAKAQEKNAKNQASKSSPGETPNTELRNTKEESDVDGARFRIENSGSEQNPLDKMIDSGPSQEKVETQETQEFSCDPEISNIDIDTKKQIQNKMMQKIGTMVNQYGERHKMTEKRKTSVFGSHAHGMSTQLHSTQILDDDTPRSSRFTNDLHVLGAQTNEAQLQEYRSSTPSNIEIRTNLRLQTVAAKKKPFQLVHKAAPNLRRLIKGAHTRN